MVTLSSERLAVTFSGLALKNPIIAGAAGYAIDVWTLRRLIHAGYSVVVTKSCTWDPMGGWPRKWRASPIPRVYFFEDDLVGIESTEALQNPGYRHMAEFIRQVKADAEAEQAFIVGSLSPRSPDEGATMAQEFERAGASAIHLDLSCPTASPFRCIQYPGLGYEKLGSYWSERVGELIELVKTIKQAVEVPVWVKAQVGRWARTSPQTIASIDRTGVNAYEAFTGVPTTLYIDIYRGRPKRGGGAGGLPGPCLRPLTIGLIADMARATKTELFASGGFHKWSDVIEGIMVGASAIAISTAIYKNVNVVKEICEGIEYYMVSQALERLEDIKGCVLDYLSKEPGPFWRLYPEYEEQARQLAKGFTGRIEAK